MFTQTCSAIAARLKSSRAAVAAGTAISAVLVAEYERQKGDDGLSTSHIEQEQLVKGLADFPSITPANVTMCDAVVRPRARLARTRTMRRMEDTSTLATVRSKYDVRWKNPLGEGGFGAVYLATDRKTGEAVAVKKISKRFTDNSSFQKEMNALLHIRHKGGHPNICGLRENFDEGGFYYLVLDLVSGGEMFDHLINNGAYSEADAARLLREVGSSLAFLHGTDIVHGDLKPENLMLSSENASDAVLKVVDFGCAQVLDESSPFYEKGTHIVANTPGYSPPELVDKSRKLKKLDPSVDMFAIGVILFIMLTGAHPFDLQGTATDEELNKRIASRDWPSIRNSRITAHLSPSAIDVIEKLMHRNPNRRLTAQQMLNHPWVRGDTATTGKIADSDKRLSAYRKYKSKLEAKVFQSMVEWSDDPNDSDLAKKTSLIERSFRMLDPDNKGYITTNDVRRLSRAGSQTEAGDDSAHHLSLSGFSDLLSENMKNRYFPAGHVVYREGERGSKMFFVNSGRVEVSTKDGYKATREQGDFFGEGALLSGDGKRATSVKCGTPVHVIEISKEYFEKYLADGYSTQLDLKETDKIRKTERVQAILASTKNLTPITLSEGSYLYKQGEPGKDLYILEKGTADVLVGDHVVFSVQPGEFFGLHALVFDKPRNTSAICVSDECKVQIMKADEFHKILESRSSVRESLRELTLRREFQKALVFATKRAFPKREKELWEAFDAADYNRSGRIDLSDISVMLKNMDSSFTEKDIRDIMSSLDLDGTGKVSWEEFKRIFGMEGTRRRSARR